MGFPEQIGIDLAPAHAMVVSREIVGVNGEASVTQFLENGRWAQVPASPRQRRVAVHVFGVSHCTRIQEKLDAPFSTECCGTM